MKQLLILWCLTLSFPYLGIGQQIELSTGVGMSRYNLRQVNFPTYISQFEKFKHYPTWSVTIGADSKFDLGKNFSSSFGLNYSKKGNREYTVYNSYNWNNPDSTFQTISDFTTHMHYVGLTALIHVNKINLFIGGQVSYLWRIDIRNYYNVTGRYNGNEIYSDTQKGMNVFKLGEYDYFNRIDFGLLFGYEHKINSKAKLTLSYYQGLQGVLKDDFFINYLNSQLLLGIRYTLTQEKDKELN
jgi:hypothetical protein